MSLPDINKNKDIHIITHGQTNLIEPIKTKLNEIGFPADKMKMASMDDSGEIGEYVAMLWPPMPNVPNKEVIINEIINKDNKNTWSMNNMKEIIRISL